MKTLLLSAIILANAACHVFGNRNLLLNQEFRFNSFDSSRDGRREEFRTGSVPFWDQEAYGDAQVYRAPRVTAFHPQFSIEGVVRLQPGKTLRQFSLLSEMQLDHGDAVSLSVFGYQSKPNALRAVIARMQPDVAPGDWSPAQYGQTDKRTFRKQARGELIRAELSSGSSGAVNEFELKVENAVVPGSLKQDREESGDQPNTIGLQVEFTNTSDQDVWIYAPCLVKGPVAQNRVTSLRNLPDDYRHLPKTIAKLRRGEPLHIVSMGSSIDRASANPPPYLYDEDPESPQFKEPVSKGDFLFDGQAVGHPEWTPYIGQWRHYFSYAGRLRQSLMRRYDYPIDKILLNTMACDGSSIGESHSALAQWSTLALQPDPELNGHAGGSTWEKLYPAVFARPEGARPDLVIFGSGANEKIDGADEIALFEGAIRWFQRHYPDIEFVFCMWQKQESSTSNTGMLKELALRYGIPFVDVGRELDLATRHGNSHGLMPGDGHPQAAGHYVWSHFLERAFQGTDPFEAGIPQRYLPGRASAFTIGWEGEMRTYEADSPRIYKGSAFLLDDTVVNLWASSNDKKVTVLVDGEGSEAPRFANGSRRRPVTSRDPRNSTFAIGRLTLGDRHLVEVSGDDSKIVAADPKTALNRVWHGVESKSWQKAASAQPFVSQWGAPYGSSKLTLEPGQTARLEWVGTDCSVAWLSAPEGGALVVRLDGAERLNRPTNEPFRLATGEQVHMENRQGIRDLPFGVHTLEVEAKGGPVVLLGAFSYDTRPNREAERILRGVAAPGDAVPFSAPYKATPLVICSGGLTVREVSKEQVVFAGEKPGTYQAIGE